MWDRMQRANRATLAIAGAALAVVLFLCVNLIASLGLSAARADLTQDQVYTVSPSTRHVLSAVTEPILVRLYLSSALIADAPDVRSYAVRVRELLRSYELISGGKVHVQLIDPVPFSAAEDEAIGYNLASFNLSRAGEQGYIGVVGTNSVDRIETIPVLTPARENYLEYDLTRMVLRLSRPSEPSIGVMDGLGLFGNRETGRRPAASLDRLAKDFNIVQLNATVTAIPDELDALVVIHPHDLTASALYAIDQYAIRGGPVLVFLDVVAEHSPPQPNNPAMPLYPESSLDPLMTAWGVKIEPRRVVGDINMALQIRARAGPQVIIAKYPPWLLVDRDNLNPDDLVTRQLSLMRIETAGSLTHVGGAQTTFTPLIKTTPESMLIDQATVLSRSDPNELVSAFKSSGIAQVLAARVTGTVDTVFSAVPPPPQSQDDNGQPPAPPPPLIRRSQKPLNVIVVADTDMLADELNINPNTGQPTSQNTDFVINALDSLEGGGELIALRSQGVSFRPFTTVDKIEAAANEKYRATEEKLQADLKDTQGRLAAMRAQAGSQNTASGGPPGEALSAQQQQTIAQFNQRIVEVRQQLRDTRGSLRTEIDALGNWLRLINILAVPAIIVLVGIGASLWRQIRLSRYLRHKPS
jgi:ABC-type uncharacterized transport system involved in gliding motility auxiliary subunit